MSYESGPTTTPGTSVFAQRLDEAAGRLTADLDVPQVALQLLHALLEETGAARGSVMLVNRDTGRLRIVAGVGLPPEAVGVDLKPAVRRISDWVLREGEALVLNGEVRDKRFDGSDPRRSIDSALSMPLVGSRGPLGVLNLARVSPASVFTPEGLARIQERAGPLGAFFERLEELRWAVRSWQTLRRDGCAGGSDRRDTRRYQLASALIPAPFLAGDLCERVTHTSGAQSVMIADVAGRGARAVAMSALVRGLFLGLGRHSRSPAEIARAINADLCTRFEGRGHASFWIAHLHPTGEVVSCNAGFPEPLWIPIDGAPPGWLGVGGPLGGVVPDAAYEEEKIQLLPGDVVLAVSDGVPRAGNPAGQELGLARVEELAGEIRRQPLDRLVADMVRSALDFSGAATPVDDLAALAVRFTRDDD